MKTQQQSADRKQHTWQRPGARRSTTHSHFQRSTRSWVIALVVPILITLLGAALTPLLTNQEK
jgi:hypothetical protein